MLLLSLFKINVIYQQMQVVADSGMTLALLIFGYDGLFATRS